MTIAPPAVRVGAGDDGTATMTIRNTGTVVDEFTITMLGACAPWARVGDERLRIPPGHEATTTITFAPPRHASVRAGEAPFGVRVVATNQGDVVVEEGTVTVAPVHAVTASLVPRTSKAKRRTRHHVVVANHGNGPVQVDLEAVDPDLQLRFMITPVRLAVDAGGEESAEVEVKAMRTFSSGPEQYLPFHVEIRPGTGDSVRVDGALRQLPGRPRWLGRAAVAGMAVVVLALMLISINARRQGPSSVTLTEVKGGGGSSRIEPLGDGDIVDERSGANQSTEGNAGVAGEIPDAPADGSDAAAATGAAGTVQPGTGPATGAGATATGGATGGSGTGTSGGTSSGGSGGTSTGGGSTASTTTSTTATDPNAVTGGCSPTSSSGGTSSAGAPVLPPLACEFSIPRARESKLIPDNDDRLVRGWYDPDNTAAWLCIDAMPVNKDTWWADGANCEGGGLWVRMNNPGTYYMDYRAKECASDASCGPPYSAQTNRITIRVR